MPWPKGKPTWNKGLKGSQIPWIKGKHHSPESNEKNRLAHIGKPSWNKGLKGINTAWNKGLKGYNSDYPRSKEWRSRISAALKGKNNGSWCGGIARKKYPFEFNAALKKKIEDRDVVCLMCGSRKKKMDVHHIDYDKNNSSEDNLILLCCSCHIKTNTRMKRKFYQKLLSEKVQRL